MEYYTLRQMFD